MLKQLIKTELKIEKKQEKSNWNRESKFQFYNVVKAHETKLLD